MAEIDETTQGPSTQRMRLPPRLTLRLVTSGGKLSTDVHALRAGATPIGRRVDSVMGICIDADPRVSREHAVLVVDGEVVRLQNKSQHGTIKNGVRIDADAEVGDGDVLQLGDTFFVCRLVPSDVVDVPNVRIVGRSPAAARLRSTVRLVGPTHASILLLGPTGTGKEVLAHALHDESDRTGAFVVVNATTLTESSADTQLFGRATGTSDNIGHFRQADRGTLYLDNVGDLPLGVQPKLLRVLDDRRVTPVGASQSAPVDVRIIASSNEDLDARVRAGTFRADLYARLAEIPVPLPPVTARREDILELLMQGLKNPAMRLEPALVSALLTYHWPYNVREVMTVATELGLRGAGAAVLTLDLVEERLRDRGAPAAVSPSPREIPVPDKEQLMELLKKHKGVIAEIARATGRSRKQVYRWLDKYELRGAVTPDSSGDLDDETSE